MPVARVRLGDWLRDLGMAVLGIIVAVIPLALWVAWTEFLFVMVLAVGAIALVLIYMMAECGHPWRGTTVCPTNRHRESASATNLLKNCIGFIR